MPPSGSPLSEEHLRQLNEARRELRRIQRVVAVARFDGWTVAVFAGLTALFGITQPVALLIAAVMAGIAAVELRSAQRLEQLDVSALRMLGLNQLILGALVIVYAAWRIHGELTGPGVYDSLAAADPQLSRMLEPVRELTRTIAVGIYGTLIAVALGAQGGLALYYFTRTKVVEAYLRQTPPWIIAIQRMGVAP